jgi:hypothetical protein
MVTSYSSPTTGVIAYQTDRSEARLIELCPLLQVPLSLKLDRLVQTVMGEHVTHLPCTVYFRGDGGILGWGCLRSFKESITNLLLIPWKLRLFFWLVLIDPLLNTGKFRRSRYL